jgi:hypothetical protein
MVQNSFSGSRNVIKLRVKTSNFKHSNLIVLRVEEVLPYLRTPFKFKLPFESLVKD